MARSGVIAEALGHLAPPLAFAGVAWSGPRGRGMEIATAPGVSAGPGTRMRVASISKIVTARVFLRAVAHLGPPAALEMDALLGYPLRHPRASDRPITAGMVAAHHAGLTDSGGYLIPRGMPLAAFLARAEVWDALPGTRFAYCNLGYVVLAAAAERVTGRRFDLLARDLLEDWGIGGGFNWSGVADRATRLPCYRPGSGGLVPQIDAQVAADGVSGPDGTRIDLADHVPGAAPGVFSPQGGLRLSLAECLTLAERLGPEPPLWRVHDGPTEPPREVFQDYGWGMQILPAPTFWPEPVIGHTASGYGLRGGVFRAPTSGVAMAYLLNGLPEDPQDRADFTAEEHAVWAALRRAAAD
ncbi:class C beta-lactamase-related serine hydrolase [Rhodobacteraceae bacterium CCMM004]|nr:class C beta-lactamase-related serine hydrolase [Rhodobacteraceae bacterium CCMM004]